MRRWRPRELKATTSKTEFWCQDPWFQPQHQWCPKSGPAWQHQLHLGTCEKCKFLGPTEDLLKQKLWAWGPIIYILGTPPCDSSEVYLSLRSTILHKIICQGLMVPPAVLGFIQGHFMSLEFYSGCHVLKKNGCCAALWNL